MNINYIEQAISITSETGHVIIATADRNGLPHVAVGHDIAQDAEQDIVSVLCRFCPGTLANVHKNDRLALVAWDARKDSGYQLVGRVREFTETSDQERHLKVRVEQVFEFTQAPHSDEAR